MKTLIFVFVTSAALNSFAEDSAAYSKIADCTTAAKEHESALHLQVFRMGDGFSDNDKFLVHFDGEEVDSIFPARLLSYDQKSKVALINFAGFITASIKDGNTSDSSVTVALSDQPESMVCQAHF